MIYDYIVIYDLEKYTTHNIDSVIISILSFSVKILAWLGFNEVINVK